MRDAVAIAVRDLRVEVTGRELSAAVVPFMAAAALLAGIAFGSDPPVLAAVAPGLVWLLLLFAAVALARGVAAAERNDRCWDLLRGLATPSALLTGKIAALWVELMVVWLVVTSLVTVLFAAAPTVAALAAGAIGTLGLAAVTTVFGVTVGGAGGSDALLAAVVLPAGLPLLVAGSQAAAPTGDALPWLALLVAVAAISTTLAWAVFPTLLEE